jgi:indole-3-pyruvate monooxygenase
MSADSRFPVIVIGAGPAGLATSYELKRRGLRHIVLERGEREGWSWANLYDSLTLHTGKHLSTLPGMKFPRSAPIFLPRAEFCEYMERYRRTFALPIETGAEVTLLEYGDGSWRVKTRDGELIARGVVVASGIIANPVIPGIPGAELFTGRLMHSVNYRRPAGFEGRRVLVVGVGNSGGEIGSELARAGAQVTVAVRSGANVVPLTLFGLPIQYASYVMRKLPRFAQERIVGVVRRMTELRRGPPVLPLPSHGPLDAIPLIGFNLVDAIREGLIDVRGTLAELTTSGARFTDGSEAEFDHIILATGFRSALAFAPGVPVDARGFAVRADRVRSARHPDLFFVGHNYDASGGLLNIKLDASLAARQLSRQLRNPQQGSPRPA